MLKVLIPAAALGLAALAVQTRSADAPTDAIPDEAMGWFLSHDGEEAKLAFGVAHSDVLAVMMTCAAGAGQAKVYGDVKPLGAAVVQARHGPSSLDPLSGDLIEDIRISVAHPALRGLAERGVIKVEGEGGIFQIKATRAERDAARRFLAYCETARV